MSFWAASIKPDAPCAYHAPPGCVLTIRTAALEEGSPPARLWLKTRGQRGEEVTALLGVLRPWGASETLKLDHSAGFGSEALALLVVHSQQERRRTGTRGGQALGRAGTISYRDVALSTEVPRPSRVVPPPT
jgi:hypothetical protein